MKTVMALSLAALCAMACNDKTTKKNTEPVDTTRTTSAVVVEPTLHDGHAAEPQNVDQNQTNMDQNQTNVDQNMDMDVDQDMSGVARDAGMTNY
jgi:hypothetical protein